MHRVGCADAASGVGVVGAVPRVWLRGHPVRRIRKLRKQRLCCFIVFTYNVNPEFLLNGENDDE